VTSCVTLKLEIETLADMDKTTKPDPSTWAIRFKNSTSTIFLHINPTSPLLDVKKGLLAALRDTYSALPSDIQSELSKVKDDDDETAERIEFGVARDPTDVELGFVPLIIPSDDGAADTAGDALKTPDPKGRPRVKPKANKNNVLNRTLKGAGLKDGGIVAFRFASAGDDEDEDAKWDVKLPKYDDDDEEDEDEDMEDVAEHRPEKRSGDYEEDVSSAKTRKRS
jgi:hypothetical protein